MYQDKSDKEKEDDKYVHNPKVFVEKATEKSEFQIMEEKFKARQLEK